MSSSEHLVFIGIGAIGLPMARRLVDCGFSVTGVDPVAAAHDRARAAGIMPVEQLADAPEADAVIVMVATPDQLEAVVSSALARPDLDGQRWVIMSTVGPDAVRAQATRLEAGGAVVVDAPVTGGVARAVTGELTIFASGPAAAIEGISGILAPLGTVRTVGTEVGDGQSIKIVNQHLCSVHIVAAAEALNLAETLGLDKAAVLDLVAGGAAGSWMLNDRGPRMLQSTDVEVTSTVGIFVKDSSLVAAAAQHSGAETPLLDIAKERYQMAADRGLLSRDDSRVIETYQHSDAN